MIKPEWTFMLDNQAVVALKNLTSEPVSSTAVPVLSVPTAWQCICGGLNSMSREKCGKCGKIKEVKKYY